MVSKRKENTAWTAFSGTVSTCADSIFYTFSLYQDISLTFKNKQYIYTIIITLLCGIDQDKEDNIGYILYHRRIRRICAVPYCN
jgi:hypothetical protein